jgi:phage/conjugal plasmid C-4 type zinc finger TraR family protein
VADDIDRAQEAEQQHRDEAIRRARISSSFDKTMPPRDCCDCGKQIEAARRRLLPYTGRCAACARAAERRLRGE